MYYRAIDVYENASGNIDKYKRRIVSEILSNILWA